MSDWSRAEGLVLFGPSQSRRPGCRKPGAAAFDDPGAGVRRGTRVAGDLAAGSSGGYRRADR